MDGSDGRVQGSASLKPTDLLSAHPPLENHVNVRYMLGNKLILMMHGVINEF
jgi:hypothetical protein